MRNTLNLTRHTAASLATDGHIFCAGTLAQCLHRWDRLSAEKRASAFLKIGRDGGIPTIFRSEQVAEMADRLELR